MGTTHLIVLINDGRWETALCRRPHLGNGAPLTWYLRIRDIKLCGELPMGYRKGFFHDAFARYACGADRCIAWLR